MINRPWLRPALMCGLLAASSAANAGFVLSSPGTSSPIEAANDFASDLAALGVTSYTLGASLQLSAPSLLTFDLWGSEAGYNNVLIVGSSVLLNTTGVAREVWGNVQSVNFGFGTGTLDFTFCALDIFSCLSNNNNPASTGFQSIGMWIDPSDSNTAWLMWDDSGAGPDDNHDDMVIKVTARPTQVPEPSFLSLLAIGAASFGFFTLRNKQRRRRTIELQAGELSRRFR